MSEYAWRVHMVIPAHDADAAASVAEGAMPGGKAEGAMFGVPLVGVSEADAAEPGFRACSSLMTDGQFRALTRGLAAAGVAARWFRMRADDERDAVGSDAVAIERERRWTWQDTLDRAGLRRALEADDG